MNLKEGQPREYDGPRQRKYKTHVLNRECWCNPTIQHIDPPTSRKRNRG